MNVPIIRTRNAASILLLASGLVLAFMFPGLPLNAQPYTRPGITPIDIVARIQILTNDSLDGRRSGSIGAQRAARYIANEFRRNKLRAFDSAKTYLQPFTFAERVDSEHFDHLSTANVAGYLEGSDPILKEQVIVIGAHYDHLGHGGRNALDSNTLIHYGADDNASGTAGVLELQQYFALTHAPHKRSLLFLSFSGEEEGLFGSKYYVDHPLIPLIQTVAMINMDMIGRLSKDSVLIVEGCGSSPLWRGIYQRLNTPKQFNLRLKDAGMGPSDHMNFYLAKKPVAFFFTGFHPDYHRSTDTWDKINAEGETRVVQFVAQLVAHLSNDIDSLPYTQAPEDTVQHSTNFHVYVGGVPDYGYEGDGVKISAVSGNSPAEKAGFKAEDVIVEFAGRKIKTIYDYTDALSKAKPGDTVKVGLLRAGKPITVEVILGKRAANH